MTSRFVGITLAIVFHVAILLFGGIFFLKSGSDEDRKKTVENVELVSPQEDEKKKDKTPEAEAKKDEAKEEQEKAEEIHQAENVPDLKELEKLDAAAAAPALDAMSLGALEEALSSTGGAAGDAFGTNAVDFASGGRIGGVGRAIDDQGGESTEPFAIADLDQKPRPILQPAPQYPWELRQKKIEGTVSVLFIVDETGRVVNPKIETSPNPGFERPVLDALRQWKFEAAVRGGKKVPARMRIPIRFSASQS